MAMTRAAKNGLAIILFLVFVVWISNLDRSPTTSNSARPPLIYRKAPPSKKVSPAERLATTSNSALTYAVVDERIYDAPIKTQIEQHIAVSGVPTEAELRVEILKRYRSAKARGGFRYHNPATNIYIYIYGTKEQASREGGRWIGMIAMGSLDKAEPRVVINQTRLAALSQKPEDRFGLLEQERKKVFRKVWAAEDRARREAMARVPDSQVMKQIDLESKLQEKYRAEIARKYNLTDDQLLKISVEGVMKGW